MGRPVFDRRLINRSIVLVGLMGVGKSSVGRRLAQRLGIDFVDADTEIEKAAGLPIPEIFRLYGEAEFRRGERRVLARLLDEKPRIVATGGGAFMDEETRARIAADGVSIWLRADVAVIARRVMKRRHTRPLIAEGDAMATLERLVAERHPVYATADLAIDSTDAPHEVAVDAIIALLSRTWPALTATKRPRPQGDAARTTSPDTDPAAPQ
ncbi:shikimate kinase [Tistrella arctica]|uniref:shikimate kinase n=1 Tax=Tistrella TaxID=171436 RepID=UPI0031F63F81